MNAKLWVGILVVLAGASVRLEASGVNLLSTNGAHSPQSRGPIARCSNGLPIAAVRSYRDLFTAASTTQEERSAWRPQ